MSLSLDTPSLSQQTEDQEWTEVKKKTKRFNTKRPEPCPQDQVQNIVKSVFEDNRYVFSVLIHGSSISPLKFSKTSDVDIMVFVKTTERLPFREWKADLEDRLSRKVDLVVMRVTGEVQNPEYRDRVFYEQVYETGLNICGDNFKDFLDRSKKIAKL